MDPVTLPFYFHLVSSRDLCQNPDDRASLANDCVIDTRPLIQVLFEYPLDTATTRILISAVPWTRRLFAEAVAKEYAEIYGEEQVERRPGLLRGIWGHGLGDLVLEGASRDADGLWTLAVGS